MVTSRPERQMSEKWPSRGLAITSWFVAIVAIAFAGLVAPSRLRAQEVRGMVMSSNGNTPAGGVVAVLLHPTRDDSIIARAVTTERGRFTLKSPPVTGARLRLLRIGFEPMQVGAFTLTAGEVRDVSVTLNDVRIQLAKVDVKATSRCQVRPDGAQLVSQLFVQARTALIASTTPLVGNISAAQVSNFRRSQDRRGQLLSPIQRITQTGSSVRPYSSLSIDSLQKVGYVVNDNEEEGSGGTYYAPDAEVLLSDQFLARHCLQLVQGKDSMSGSIGIGFRPTVGRSALVDVSGTFWLDRVTSELQFLDYKYEGLPPLLADANLGGRVEYAQLSNGSWFVNNWSIRMPIMTSLSVGMLARMNVGGPQRIAVSGQLVEGGQVQSIRVDDRVLYINPDAARAGQMPRDRDDERAAIAAALKSLESNGNRISVAAPDSTTPAAVCAGQTRYEHEGLLKGRVLDENRNGVKGASVKVEWKDSLAVYSITSFRWINAGYTTTTDDLGNYSICGISSIRVVSVTATRDTVWTRPASVRVSFQSPVATLDIPLARAVTKALAKQSPADNVAPVAGVPNAATLLVTTAAGEPVPYALVNLNGSASRVADANGVLQFSHGANDTVRVTVKRMGYESYEGNVARRSAADPFTIALLPASRNLATVNVRDKATKSPLELSGFYERMSGMQRAAVTGEFFAPEDIEARATPKLTDFLKASRFVQVRYVRLNPNEKESAVIAGRAGCAMVVLIDGSPIQGMMGGVDGKRRDAGGLDINELVGMSDITAIEIYPSIAGAPQAIASRVMGNACGVIAIWTRTRR